MSQTLYLRCRPGDVSSGVILVGDRARIRLFAEVLEGARVVQEHREFTTLSGSCQGVLLTVISTGIGAPATAIVLSELAALGVRAVVRAGTALAIAAPLGQMILARQALRLEATSATYLPPERPAVASPELLVVYQHLLQQEGQQYQVGLTATADGFYSQLYPAEPAGNAFLRELEHQGVLAADMETSAVLAIGEHLGLTRASLCVTTVQALGEGVPPPARVPEGESREPVTSPRGALDPDERVAAERRLAELAARGLARWLAAGGILGHF